MRVPLSCSLVGAILRLDKVRKKKESVRISRSIGSKKGVLGSQNRKSGPLLTYLLVALQGPLRVRLLLAASSVYRAGQRAKRANGGSDVGRSLMQKFTIY